VIEQHPAYCAELWPMPSEGHQHSTGRGTQPGESRERGYVCRSTDDEEARSDPRVPNTTASLEHVRFPNLVTFSSAIDDFVKETKKVSKINPESAIEASSINPPIEEGIVAFYHHKPSALEALHTCPTLSTLSNTIHN